MYGLLTWADAPIGTSTIPLCVLAAVVIGPYNPGSDLVDNPTVAPTHARLVGTRGRRSPGREGTCRSPT
jgi:hypothetical protein